MDNAVALVQTYLRVNGYLTVTEFPIVEAVGYGGYQTATDLDVLGFRFGHSCTLTPSAVNRDAPDPDRCWVETDPALNIRTGVSDMIIGEVKEGRAVLNRAASNPSVLAAALTRFGCCEPHEAVRLAQQLAQEGRATTPGGHRVRLVAFGSLPPEVLSRRFEVILLGDILEYLREHVHRNWSRLQASESKDPGLSFLMTLEKAQRGGRGSRGRHGISMEAST
jgi:hypothetical protein